MRLKVKAVSSEARASATIIGCMPLGVAGLVYLTSPKYIRVLFVDPTGQTVLLICGAWMVIGVLVMRKMINFEF
jgi:tight adherence protein B